MTETEAVREQVDALPQAHRRLRAEIAKSIVGNREVVDGVHHVHARRRPRAARGRARARQDDARAHAGRDARRSRSRASSSRPTSCRPTSSGTTVIDETQGGGEGVRVPQGARSSRTSSSPTRSTARRRRRRARCSRRCRSTASRVGKRTHVLDEPFVVLATQNPLEMEGTYPLPEAQLDRFFFKLHVPFPGPRRAPRDPRSHDRRGASRRAARCSIATTILADAAARARRCPSRGTCRTTRFACSRRRTPTAPTRPTSTKRFVRYGARRAARRRSSSPPRSARSSTAASPRASTTCAPSPTRRFATACSSTSRARPRASRPTRSSTRSSRPSPESKAEKAAARAARAD